MEIRIVDKSGNYDELFFSFLKDKIREKFYDEVNVKKLLPFEIFINENPKYKSLFKKYISAYDICLTAFYNLKLIDYKPIYLLKIDEVIKLPNTNIKLIELCKLIDNGNIGLKAYPIFTKVFKYVQEHVEEYYAEYTFKGN